MSQSGSAASPRRNAWIISPVWDLAFLVATPLAIVPILTVLARRAFTPEQISLVVISFASLGHHLPGFMRAYGDAELFRRFRLRFLLAPPVVLATSLLFAWRDLHGLSLILLFWSTWHGLMQTYGFMRIYDLKRGVAGRRSAQLDFALCLALFVAGVVFSDARVFGITEALWQSGIPPLDVFWLRAARWAVGAATGLILGAYLVDVVRTGRRRGGITWNKLLLAGTTGWLYWVSGSISTNILVGVAMFEVFHAVQYYAIVWVYNRKLADRVGRRFGPLGFLFRHRWTFLLLYLAAIGAFGCIRFFGAQVQSDEFQKLLLAILTTSTLLHFYYDGFIWKVREAETSANLDIDRGLSPWERLQVPAVRHLAKWGLLYAVLAGLLWLEWGVAERPDRESRQLATLAAWTPELPELQLRLASRALREDDAATAVELAGQAVRRRPRSHQAHAALGQALLAAGQYAEAAEALQAAVALQPEAWRPDAWRSVRELGIAHQRLGQWDEAERLLVEAQRLQPEMAGRAWDLGVLYVQRGDHARAVESFERARELASSSLSVRIALVESLTELDRLEQAEREAFEGCRLRPRSARAHLALGKVRLRAKRFAEAVGPLETALRLDAPSPSAPSPSGQSPDILYPLGVARMHLGERARAERCFRQVLDGAPDHALAAFQLGNLDFMERRYAEAERRFVACTRLTPDFADAFHNLGAARYCLGQVEGALDAYREALRLRPDEAAWHYNFGLLLWELGRLAEARSHVARASELGADVDRQLRRALGMDAEVRFTRAAADAAP